MSVTLEVSGSVARPRTFDFDGLAALPEQIGDVSSLVPNRSGGAVPLRAILASVNPDASARFITIEAEEGYSASVPLEAVADQAIVWYRDGGQPIAREAGGPLRFLIPDVAACKTAEIDACANVKRLTRLVLSAEPGRDTRPTTRKQHEELHERESDTQAQA